MPLRRSIQDRRVFAGLKPCEWRKIARFGAIYMKVGRDCGLLDPVAGRLKRKGPPKRTLSEFRSSFCWLSVAWASGCCRGRRTTSRDGQANREDCSCCNRRDCQCTGFTLTDLNFGALATGYGRVDRYVLRQNCCGRSCNQSGCGNQFECIGHDMTPITSMFVGRVISGKIQSTSPFCSLFRYIFAAPRKADHFFSKRVRT